MEFDLKFWFEWFEFDIVVEFVVVVVVGDVQIQMGKEGLKVH